MYQSYFGADGTRSWLTFMVYLCDDFEGGETTFPDLQKVIEPKAGSALLFQHAGQRVTRGTKLVLRSDVLFRWRKQPDA